MKTKYRLSLNRKPTLMGFRSLVDGEESSASPKGVEEASTTREKKSSLKKKTIALLILTVASLGAAIYLMNRNPEKAVDETGDDSDVDPESGVVTEQSVDVTGPPIEEPDINEGGFLDYLSKAVDNVQTWVGDFTETLTPSKGDTSLPTRSVSKGAPESVKATKGPIDPMVASEREKKLSAKGLFTDEEKDVISLISTHGVTTSATVNRRMPQEVYDSIVEEATKAGLDPGVMLRIASMESGGNPYAISGTGAVGVYQFTSRTGLGFGLTNRFNYRDNIKAAMQLAISSQKSLSSSGLSQKVSSSSLALYLSHQIGPRGAKEVLSKPRSFLISDLSKSTSRNVRLNFGGNNRTVGQYLDANEEALTNNLARQVSSSEPPVDARIYVASVKKESPVPVKGVSDKVAPSPAGDVPMFSKAVPERLFPSSSPLTSIGKTAVASVSTSPTSALRPSGSSSLPTPKPPTDNSRIDEPMKVAKASNSPIAEEDSKPPTANQLGSVVRLKNGLLVNTG